MKSLDTLRSKLESIGAKLDDGQGSYTTFVCCDAPEGYVWISTLTPTIIIQYGNFSGQTWLTEALRYAYKEELSLGLRLADEEELKEIRWNNDDDDWGKGINAESPKEIQWPK